MADTAPERIDKLLNKLNKINSREDRYRFLIDLGTKLPAMDSSQKSDAFLVPGCISKAWLYPYWENQVLCFKADSEAQIPKGVIAAILQIYNGLPPEEILKVGADALAPLGIGEQLSFNRRNSIAHFVTRIHLYAQSFVSSADNDCLT